MKTHTLLFVSFAIFFAVSVSNSFALSSGKSTDDISSVSTSEALLVEDWMIDENYWGIEKESLQDGNEEPERGMVIESWMYNDEFWGLS